MNRLLLIVSLLVCVIAAVGVTATAAPTATDTDVNIAAPSSTVSPTLQELKKSIEAAKIATTADEHESVVVSPIALPQQSTPVTHVPTAAETTPTPTTTAPEIPNAEPLEGDDPSGSNLQYQEYRYQKPRGRSGFAKAAWFIVIVTVLPVLCCCGIIGLLCYCLEICPYCGPGSEGYYA